jgi:hypothetical protein
MSDSNFGRGEETSERGVGGERIPGVILKDMKRVNCDGEGVRTQTAVCKLFQ